MDFKRLAANVRGGAGCNLINDAAKYSSNRAVESRIETVITAEAGFLKTIAGSRILIPPALSCQSPGIPDCNSGE